MRIITTDITGVMDCNWKYLEPYHDDVYVIRLYGFPRTDTYEFIQIPHRFLRLGMDTLGAEGNVYQSLESVAKSLGSILRCLGGESLFLIDGSKPESIYPYLVLRKEGIGRIHLLVLSPWKFVSAEDKTFFRAAMEDLSEVHSILYVDSNRILSHFDEKDNNASFNDLMDYASEYMGKLLPHAVEQTGNRTDTCYFDFTTMSYISVTDGYDEIIHRISSDSSESEGLSDRHNLMGCATTPPYYPEDSDNMREYITRLAPRMDGKEVCNTLREQRKILAEANHIEFESADCPSMGPCAGTCDKCDAEAAYLLKELSRIPKNKRVYPSFEISEGWKHDR